MAAVGEDEVCRICRSGSEGGLLYRPCKCDGSIQHVHQDCLIEWLQHSKKKYCELCNHTFAFHKKYKSSTPSGRLPSRFYAWRLLSRTLYWIRYALRALTCALAWLVFLPLVNIFTLRGLMWTADVLLWGMNSGPRPDGFHLNGGTNATITLHPRPSTSASSASTSASHAAASSVPSIADTSSSQTFLGVDMVALAGAFAASRPLGQFWLITLWQELRRQYGPLVLSLKDDCFEGQILTCIIVVVFVGVFLLREWVMQHLPQVVERPDEAGEQAVQVQAQGLPAEQAEAAIQAIRAQVEQAAAAARAEARAQDAAPTALPSVPEASAISSAPSVPGPQPTTEPTEESARSEPGRSSTVPAPYTAHTAAAASSQRDGRNEFKPPRGSRLFGQPDEEELRQLRLRYIEQRTRAREAMSSSSRAVIPDTEPSEEELLRYRDGQRLSRAGRFLQPQKASRLGTAFQNGNGAPESPVDADEEDKWSDTSAEASNETNDARPERSSPRIRPDLDRPSDLGDHSTDLDADTGFQANTGAPAISASTSAAAIGSDSVEREQVAEMLGQAQLARRVPSSAGSQSSDGEDDDWEDIPPPEAERENHQRRVPPLQDDFLNQLLDIATRQGAGLAEEVPLDRRGDGDDDDDAAAQDEDLDPWADDAEDPRAFEDDMEGILEAIGLHGPIIGLLQNLALLTVLCSFAIFVVIAVPFGIARVVGTGEKVIWLATFPVKMMRKITDPFFDGIISALTSVISPLVGSAKSSPQATSGSLGNAAAKFSPSSASKSLSSVDRISAFASDVGHAVQQWLSAIVWDLQARLNARIYGKAMVDRVVCVLLGHSYWIGSIMISSRLCKYFKITALTWLQNLIQEELLIVKVGAFIGIELVAFPLGCGFLLDLCCLPLWPHNGLSSRVESCLAAPVTFLFLHWVAGTLSMFLFAQFVTLTRDIARPGVLCWIRDPNDPNFQPVKEILDRRSITQLAKIGTSVLMYATVLVATVGVPSVTIFLASYFADRFVGSTLLPLRTSTSTPAAAIAVDLVTVIVSVPWLVKRAKPARLMRRGYSRWWKTVTATFRLSSFLRGGRHKEEEGPEMPANHTHFGREHSKETEDSAPKTAARPNTGSFARVPADHNAIMSAPLVIRTDINGVPLDDKGMQGMRAQHEAMKKNTGAPKPKYTIVYVPPYLRLRLWGFVISLFLSMAALITACVCLPLLSGRMISALMFTGEVHDGHSYLVGSCFCLALMASGRGLHRLVKGKTRDSDGNEVVIEYDSSFAARLLREGANAIALVFYQRTIIPLLFGMAYQQYLEIPMRMGLAHDAPVSSVPQAWVVGTMLHKITVYAVTDQVYDAWKAEKIPYFSLTIKLATALVFPPVTTAMLRFAVAGQLASMPDGQFWLRVSYIAAAVVSAAYICVAQVTQSMASWTGVLKDELYLEQTELINYSSNGGEEGKEDGTKRENSAIGSLPDHILREQPQPAENL